MACGVLELLSYWSPGASDLTQHEPCWLQTGTEPTRTAGPVRLLSEEPGDVEPPGLYPRTLDVIVDALIEYISQTSQGRPGQTKPKQSRPFRAKTSPSSRLQRPGAVDPLDLDELLRQRRPQVLWRVLVAQAFFSMRSSAWPAISATSSEFVFDAAAPT